VRPSSTVLGHPIEQGPEALLGPATRRIHSDPVPPDDVGDLVAIHADDVPEHEHRALKPCQLRHCSREVRVDVELSGEVQIDADLWDLCRQVFGAACPAAQFIETREADAPEEPCPQ
jgi:hypothetical protein